jgi:choice-of-anchor A domain-containing protein
VTSTVYGDAITGGGSVTGTRIQGVIDTSGANPQLSNLAQAISEAVLLAGSLSSLTPTQVLPGISVGNNQSRSIGTTVAGLNVIQIPTITSGSRFTLTIKGAPGDTVVVNLGSLVLGQQATVNLNGLQPNQVIFNIAGALTIDINPQSISGTFLAPASACAIDQNLTFAGALYCGGNITFGNNLTYTNDPFDPGPFLPAPVPEAGAVYLVGTELAALLLLRRRPYGRRRPA